MIKAGSFVNLTTKTRDKNCYYARVEIVSISPESLTIKYVAKITFDEKTKKLVPVVVQESFSRRHIERMQELL
jgi:hypothetical protein